MSNVLTLPWVGWIDRYGSHLTMWEGETREVVLTGAKGPHDPLPAGSRVYEVPKGRRAEDVAREAGGIVVIVFDAPQRFGPEWEPGLAPEAPPAKEGGPLSFSSLYLDGFSIGCNCGDELESKLDLDPITLDRKWTLLGNVGFTLELPIPSIVCSVCRRPILGEWQEVDILSDRDEDYQLLYSDGIFWRRISGALAHAECVRLATVPLSWMAL